MKCPYCLYEDTRVVDSRQEDDIVRRRRECDKCGKRFTTFERPEIIELWVLKKDDRKERFDRDKLRRGIARACEKRSISPETIEQMLDKIEIRLRKRKDTVVRSSDIGNLVMHNLKKIDPVAYVRFASVYKEFKDIDEFQSELNKLR